MSRQKLGQHFLQSSRVLHRIVSALEPRDTEGLVVEIGPGKGALTEHLLEHFSRVVAIELDRELGAELRLRWGQVKALEIVEGNALEADWSQWGPGVLAGNLPYYVATPLISHYLRRPGDLRHAVFLIQKEVAERITASPGTRDYGYFSVECQFLAHAEYLFSVPPGAFRPPPKVDSAVIRLTPQRVAPEVDTESFLSFVSACFRQKRKTLRNNLAATYELDHLDDLGKRAEQLSVHELVQLHASLCRRAR